MGPRKVMRYTFGEMYAVKKSPTDIGPDSLLVQLLNKQKQNTRAANNRKQQNQNQQNQHGLQGTLSQSRANQANQAAGNPWDRFTRDNKDQAGHQKGKRNSHTQQPDDDQYPINPLQLQLEEEDPWDAPGDKAFNFADPRRGPAQQVDSRFHEYGQARGLEEDIVFDDSAPIQSSRFMAMFNDQPGQIPQQAPMNQHQNPGNSNPSFNVNELSHYMNPNNLNYITQQLKNNQPLPHPFDKLNAAQLYTLVHGLQRRQQQLDQHQGHGQFVHPAQGQAHQQRQGPQMTGINHQRIAQMAQMEATRRDAAMMSVQNMQKNAVGMPPPGMAPPGMEAMGSPPGLAGMAPPGMAPPGLDPMNQGQRDPINGRTTAQRIHAIAMNLQKTLSTQVQQGITPTAAQKSMLIQVLAALQRLKACRQTEAQQHSQNVNDSPSIL